jgi:hypothetical protein
MLRVGAIDMFRGNVTTLEQIGPRPASTIENALGFGAGRLSDGYWILLLKQPLTPDDFEFDGTTLRSGGREGLPAATSAADTARPRVHDRMKTEYGDAGYLDLQKRALASVMITGSRRIAKVIPERGHDVAMAPNHQYPMGGGGLQWVLRNKCRFLVALHVDRAGKATAPGFSTSLAAATPYLQLMENRRKVAQYLASA